MLREIAPDLWELHRPLALFGLIEIGHRMTVVRSPSGGLLLHSPTEWNEELDRALKELGPVQAIVAPSQFHNLYLAPYVTRYPDARRLTVPGFPERYPELRFRELLTRETDAGSLVWIPIEGMPKINEWVALHRPSRTLIVADLVMNHQADRSLPTRLFLGLTGVYHRTAISRLFRAFIKDRQAFARSIDAVPEREFDRIVMGHGEIIETGGKQALREATEAIRA